MKKRIWITKDWEMSCTVTIWTTKPMWCVNVKDSSGRSGHWSNTDGTGLLGSTCIFSRVLDRFFKVTFRKLKGQDGYIAERILSINLPKRKQEKQC